MTQSRPVSANRRRYGLAVFIGRFSPPHLGHRAVIEQALRVAESVLITIGSANAARRHDYVPFTAHERETMIRLMFSAADNKRINFFHAEDQGNINKWSGLIRAAANRIEPDNGQITLIGHSKDNSSYYLKSFPGWDSTDVENYLGLSATTFRDLYFGKGFDNLTLRERAVIDDGLHPEIVNWLTEFARTPQYAYLVEERTKCIEDLNKYGRLDHKGVLRYGPVLAADFVCVQGDHMLVVERNTHPFKGKIVFPGGIVEYDEDVIEAALREGVREETGLKVPELVLRKAYVATETFANPFRDPRGRVVSFASLFHLTPTPPASMTDPKEIEKFLALPRVRKGQDKEKEVVRAFWMPIVEARREDMGFDHYMMLQRMLELLPREI